MNLRRRSCFEHRLIREARRRRQTRSEIARNILEEGLAPGGSTLANEARRQSLLASGRRSDRDALRFMAAVADMAGWRGQP